MEIGKYLIFRATTDRHQNARFNRGEFEWIQAEVNRQ